jgi:hypothetical protein
MDVLTRSEGYRVCRLSFYVCFELCFISGLNIRKCVLRGGTANVVRRLKVMVQCAAGGQQC